MAVVTPTDRPKSDRNRCVIEVFGGVFVLLIACLIFCLYRGFCYRSDSDLIIFSWNQGQHREKHFCFFFYLDFLMSIGRDCGLHTSFYDKRHDFNFHITNFPFLSNNIPSSSAYGVLISQPIRYALACSSCFILMARRLSSKLLKQWYLVEFFKSSFRTFTGRYGNLIQQYEVSFSGMLNDILTLDQWQWFPTDKNFHQFHYLDTELDLHRNTSDLNWALETGVSYQQGTLTLPDTWFRPLFGNCLYKCSNYWNQFSRICRVFLDFSPWIPIGTFSILL